MNAMAIAEMVKQAIQPVITQLGETSTKLQEVTNNLHKDTTANTGTMETFHTETHKLLGMVQAPIIYLSEQAERAVQRSQTAQVTHSGELPLQPRLASPSSIRIRNDSYPVIMQYVPVTFQPNSRHCLAGVEAVNKLGT
jgi:hypothetical protein